MRDVTDSPSALLERAAERLAELAEKASEGPWWVEWTSSDWRDTSPSKVFGRGKPLLADTGDAYVGDLEWVSAMSPVVAQPLVEWLRAEAEYIKGIRSRRHLPPQTVRAVAFARHVLGEPLSHDWFFPYDSHPGARECSRCGAHDDSQPCR